MTRLARFAGDRIKWLAGENGLQEAAHLDLGGPSMFGYGALQDSPEEQQRLDSLYAPGFKVSPSTVPIAPGAVDPMKEPHYTPWHYDDWRQQQLIREDYEFPVS